MQRILYSVWYWTWTEHTERERASAVDVHEVWLPFFCIVGSEVTASSLSVLDPFYIRGFVINLSCRMVRRCHKVLIYNSQSRMGIIYCYTENFCFCIPPSRLTWLLWGCRRVVQYLCCPSACCFFSSPNYFVLFRSHKFTSVMSFSDPLLAWNFSCIIPFIFFFILVLFIMHNCFAMPLHALSFSIVELKVV